MNYLGEIFKEVVGAIISVAGVSLFFYLIISVL